MEQPAAAAAHGQAPAIARFSLEFSNLALEAEFDDAWQNERAAYDAIWACVTFIIQLAHAFTDDVLANGSVGPFLFQWAVIVPQALRVVTIIASLAVRSRPRFAQLRRGMMRLYRAQRVGHYAKVVIVGYQGMGLLHHDNCGLVGRFLRLTAVQSLVMALNFRMLLKEQLLFGSAASVAVAAGIARQRGGVCALLRDIYVPDSPACQVVGRHLTHAAHALDIALDVLGLPLRRNWHAVGACVPVMLLAELLLGVALPYAIMMRSEWNARVCFLKARGLGASDLDPERPPLGCMLGSLWIGPLLTLAFGWPLVRGACLLLACGG